MSKVDIAMATYNGGLYLAQQINSICNQTFTDWRLFIRDDGSRDDTVSIILKYASEDSRIIFISDSLGGLGVSMNFAEVILHCTAPYTMLADQDDIWAKDKIEKSVEYIQRHEKYGRAVLVFSNSTLTNSDLSIKYGLNYKMDTIPSLESFIFHNAGYQGANMIFNSILREKLFPFLERSKVHDYHISLIGLLMGDVYFLGESLMLYRRHETTTTICNRTIMQRLKSFLHSESMIYDPEMVDYLVRLVADRSSSISNSHKKLIHMYTKIISKQTSCITKVRIVNRFNFTLRNSRLYLIVKVLLTK